MVGHTGNRERFFLNLVLAKAEIMVGVLKLEFSNRVRNTINLEELLNPIQ